MLLRRPQAGLLTPRSLLQLTIETPFAAGEQPIVLSPNTPDVVIREANGDRVVLENRGNAHAPYLLLVVPSAVVKTLSMEPAKLKQLAAESLAEAGHALLSGILKRLT